MMNQRYSKLNGIEFRNKNVQGFVEAKDIKFIHGRRNHKESQGAVETLAKLFETIFHTITKMIR